MLQHNRLRVLLASPSDVAAEREAADQIVKEINNTLPSSAAGLELLRWETHTVPEFGTDAQDAVNRQIGDDFDIFVGLLWTRFGTPTPRARSGTEEEFRRALARQRKHPETRVLFYFKTANIPYDADLTQMELVRRFRASIQDKGLVRTYDSLEDFEQNLRMALTRFALAAGGTAGDSHVETHPTDNHEEDAEEAGLFDLVDQANESLSQVSAITSDLFDGITELNTRTVGATDELKTLDMANTQAAKRARRVVNSLGEFMGTYAARLEGQLAPFREANARAFGAIQGLAEIAPDFGESATEAMRDNQQNVQMLKAALIEAQNSMDKMRGTIENQPRVTTAFNRSKRRLGAALRNLSQEMSNVIGLASEAEMLIADVLRDD